MERDGANFPLSISVGRSTAFPPGKGEEKRECRSADLRATGLDWGCQGLHLGVPACCNPLVLHISFPASKF